MGHRFAEIAFTPAVRAAQARHGSRAAYASLEAGPSHHDVLGPAERDFIAARDSVYVASIGETGWPYIQHRGGRPGFLRVVDDRTLAFVELRGNRQYISEGNIAGDPRVALFLMDYPARRRLKLLGRATLTDQPDGERLVTIAVEAFDWNCPQHITPRFTEAEVRRAVQPLRDRITELEALLARHDAASAP